MENDYTNDFQQWGFGDDTPFYQRVKNVRASLVETMNVFYSSQNPLKIREKWAFVMAGRIIDGLLNEIERYKEICKN